MMYVYLHYNQYLETKMYFYMFQVYSIISDTLKNM